MFPWPIFADCLSSLFNTDDIPFNRLCSFYLHIWENPKHPLCKGSLTIIRKSFVNFVYASQKLKKVSIANFLVSLFWLFKTGDMTFQQGSFYLNILIWKAITRNFYAKNPHRIISKSFVKSVCAFSRAEKSFQFLRTPYPAFSKQRTWHFIYVAFSL